MHVKQVALLLPQDFPYADSENRSRRFLDLRGTTATGGGFRSRHRTEEDSNRDKPDRAS